MRAIHLFGDENEPVFMQRKGSIEAIVAQTEGLAQQFGVDVELYFGNRELPPEIAAQAMTWWNFASMDFSRRHVETIISPRYRELTPNGTRGMAYAVVGESILYFMLERSIPKNIPLFFDAENNFVQYERQAFVDNIMRKTFGNTFFARYRLERAQIDAKIHPMITLKQLRCYCAALEKYLPQEADQVMGMYLEGRNISE